MAKKVATEPKKPRVKKVKVDSKEKKVDGLTVKSVETIQPLINIGLVGHVDHGKTTLTERLSGKWTDTHSEEVKRGITIRLGYADATFRKCVKCNTFTAKDKCEVCNEPTEFVRKVSFIDAPGHESLMATMLCGATIMDGALLLVAANETCPQPQTKEHLMALEMSGIKNVVIVQNKIDIVSKEDALKNYNEIKEFIKNTPFKDAPIVPISAQHGVNIGYLIEAIEEIIPTPLRDENLDPIMYVARSFDINKPGTIPDKLVGGVLGGSLKQGKFKKGMEIEIRPGQVYEEANKIVTKPIRTIIYDLKSGGKSLDEIGPGGSIGVLTKLDPAITKSDQLTGNIVGLPGKLPPVWIDLAMDIVLLERAVGTKDEIKVGSIVMNEVLMLNVNSAKTVGIVYELSKNFVRCKLKLPVCAQLSERVTISRRIGNRFRLIGYGIIKK